MFCDVLITQKVISRIIQTRKKEKLKKQIAYEKEKHNDPLKRSPRILARLRDFQCFDDSLIDMTTQFNNDSTWI